MGLTERLFKGAIERAITERLPAIREQVSRQVVAEAVPPGAYAYEQLSSAGYRPGSYELPAGFLDRVIRDSNWLYESHGLASIIITQMMSLVFEGGLRYSLTADRGLDPALEAEARKRLDLFWYDEGVDLQDRGEEFALQCLLSGEHGWRLDVDPDNGKVSLGDLPREDVEDLLLDPRDKRRLMAVKTKGDLLDRVPGETLPTAQLCLDDSLPQYRHLAGSCLYYRIDTRATKRRGSPVLQRVVDELKAEKKFRVQSSERMLHRMATFVSVTLKNMTLKEVQDYAASQPRTIPSGGVWYQTDQMERKLESATMEGSESANVIRTLITVIAGSMGMPISWFGFGDGSTRSTAEAQQEPAARASRRMKRGIFGVYEKLMYFVLDQAILHRVLAPTPMEEVEVEDQDGRKMRKLLRDCFTISVTPEPLEERKPEGLPLQATKEAIGILAADDARGEMSGVRLFAPENAIVLVNHALSRDGVGIEVVQQEETEPKTAAQPFPKVGNEGYNEPEGAK
jgi:hypothetical protein